MLTPAFLDDATSMTIEGYERLRKELDVLVTERREEVADWLRAARGDGGDPTENGDLASALEEHDLVERRIGQLEGLLASARVATPVDDGSAGIGTCVRIRREDGRIVRYELVGAAEVDAERRRISIASPIGRALAGHEAGDVVVVDTPRGPRRVEVLSVESVRQPGAAS